MTRKEESRERRKVIPNSWVGGWGLRAAGGGRRDLGMGVRWLKIEMDRRRPGKTIELEQAGERHRGF